MAQKIYQTHDDDGDICHLASMDPASFLLLSLFFFFSSKMKVFSNSHLQSSILREATPAN